MKFFTLVLTLTLCLFVVACGPDKLQTGSITSVGPVVIVTPIPEPTPLPRETIPLPRTDVDKPGCSELCGVQPIIVPSPPGKRRLRAR